MNQTIRIRRCAIQVVRKDAGAAWADEASHRALARRVQDLVLGSLDQWLEPLIASRRLEGHDIIALALDLRLTGRDLQGAAPLSRLELRERMVRALADARIEPGPRRAAADAGVTPPAAPAGVSAPPPRAAPPQAAVLGALVRAYEGGWLIHQLALTQPAALLDLAERLLAEAGAPRPARSAATMAEADPAQQAAIGAAAQVLRLALAQLLLALTIAGKAGHAGQPDPHAATAAISAEARSIDLVPTTPGDPLTALSTAAARLAEALDAPTSVANGPAATVGAQAEEAITVTAAPASAAIAAAAASVPRGRHAAASLLPFLALQPLCRHGVWQALALDQAQASALGTAFAAVALAARDAAALRPLAALFAGRGEPVRGKDLLSAARTSTAPLANLAAQCGALLLAGHDEAAPLLALREAGQLLIFERDGLAPLARLDRADYAAFAQGGAPPLVLAGGDPAELAELAAAGLDVICPGAPGRGEPWALLHGPDGWTGSSTLPPPRAAALARQAALFGDAAARAREIWRALYSAALPVPPEAGGAALDALRGSLALALGFALSEIALALGRRDPAAWTDPDPLLTITRFADLSGEVEIGERLVRVHLPMGRRFIDLRDAGLLAPLDGVPWWGGHRIEFVGG